MTRQGDIKGRFTKVEGERFEWKSVGAPKFSARRQGPGDWIQPWLLLPIALLGMGTGAVIQNFQGRSLREVGNAHVPPSLPTMVLDSTLDITSPPISEGIPSPTASQTSAGGEVSYADWRDLPADSHLRQIFEQKASHLIQNPKLVKSQGEQAILIHGGGYSRANLDVLVKDLGVRTIVDLRGAYNDDHTPVPVGDGTLADQYSTDMLNNIAPGQPMETHLNELGKLMGIEIKYYKVNALAPELTDILKQASAENPTAMFCRWGVNRSNFAWARFFTETENWSLDQLIQKFGIPKNSGGYLNQRDITDGHEFGKNN